MGTKEEELVERLMKENEEFLKARRPIPSFASNWKRWKKRNS